MKSTSIGINSTLSGLRQSELVSRTSRDVSKDEVSVNARLLEQAGFVHKLMAGAYSFLPLGNRVLTKIENIVRSEMAGVGSQEVLMPALQPRENWAKTGRWETVDILFKLKGAGERDLTLGPTHEEIVTPLVGQFIRSYRDLPSSVFQIQGKFRNEARAKSGLLRGREFRMKDMYSFHASQADLDAYYDKAIGAYQRVFQRCGLGDSTYLTYASGGMFSKYSHEFQTLTPHGEDIVYVSHEKKVAVNREIFEDIKNEPEWRGVEFVEEKAIEVGNIFKLSSRFSDAFDLSFTDSEAHKQSILMGCYGIGTTRLVGTVVEKFHDDNGMIWPKEIAPYNLHLVSLFSASNASPVPEELFQMLLRSGVEVLYDDRDLSPGAKFKDSDLIGLPSRIVVSPRGLANSELEIKERQTGVVSKISLDAFKDAAANGRL